MRSLPSTSVVIPSYRRPALLAQCLQALARQQDPADEVVVVRRRDDEQTAAVLRDSPLPVREVLVERPGALAALRAGAAASRGEVVAFTDDDAAPHPDWLARIRAHYADPAVGGVGGRDVIAAELGPAIPSRRVGQRTRAGRLRGGHHLGDGPAVRVAFLKGVCMSFRREALALPVGLRGSGAEVHNEVLACAWARAAGWELVYDPAVRVDHAVGPRFDEDGRHRRTPRAVSDEAFNLTWALVGMGGRSGWLPALHGLLVGERPAPGLARALVGGLRGERDVVANLLPSLRGQLAALLRLALGGRPVMAVTPPPDVPLLR